MLIRHAQIHDCAEAVEVWREAAFWLDGRGLTLWSAAEFSLDQTSALAERGELIVAIFDDHVAACMTLQDNDPIFWPDAPHARALYLHKLAVRRANAGVGLSTAMIDWACEFGANSGFQVLRLDCAPRTSLIDLYRRNGFRPFEQDVVNRGGFEVLRMERPLSALDFRAPAPGLDSSLRC